jgi:DNA-binding LacI/PurR family transcriptional regulator
LSDDRLEVEETLIHEADFELDSGRDATRDLLGLPERPTAVFCANDVQAIGALHECEEHGVRVPADISLVGFDDLPVAKYVRPQLTTSVYLRSAWGNSLRRVSLRLSARVDPPAARSSRSNW